MINVALFMTGFFIASCDVFMDKMLVAGYWILKRSCPYYIQHQKSGIQYQLVKWNNYLIYIPSLFAARPG